jgi:hypothetical protein
MQGTCDSPGRAAGHPSPSSIAVDEAMDRVVSGVTPLTTMTGQIPARLNRALKHAAVDRHTTVKVLLIDRLELHVAPTHPSHGLACWASSCPPRQRRP